MKQKASQKNHTSGSMKIKRKEPDNGNETDML